MDAEGHKQILKGSFAILGDSQREETVCMAMSDNEEEASHTRQDGLEEAHRGLFN